MIRYFLLARRVCIAKSPSEIPLVDAPAGIETDFHKQSPFLTLSASSSTRVASRALRHDFNRLSISETSKSVEVALWRCVGRDNFGEGGDAKADTNGTAAERQRTTNKRRIGKLMIV